MLRQLFVPILFLSLILAPTCLPGQQTKAQPRLNLAGVFSDNMVFQQQANAAIWGVAEPDQSVSITPSWSNKTTTTKAQVDGSWKTKIETPAAGGPYTVDIKTGTEQRQLKNVLVGEVWICSGQSNMQWKLRGFGDHFKDVIENANDPKIRFCQVPQIIALEPQKDVDTRWSVCTPKTAQGLSCVAYFFAEKLRQEMDIPIGLISTSWGGSSAEAWMNANVLEKEFPEFNEVMQGYGPLIEKQGALYRNKNKPQGLNQQSPSVLYNKMIRPIIPFAFRGVIWYQGEANVDRPFQYRTLFPRLIKNWREDWSQGDFPFYFVQIAPFQYRDRPLPVALLREAQLKTLAVPNTGMAVTMDIGNPKNIHPKQKQQVGERLARLALANDYGQTDLVYSGPELIGHGVENDRVRLRFKHVGSGLTSRDGKPLSHFLVAGSDRVFHPAIAEIDGETVLVSSEKVAKPLAVRFGWGNADAPNLMNQEGLPSSSFRTDDWKIEPRIVPAKKRPAKKRNPQKKKR